MDLQPRRRRHMGINVARVVFLSFLIAFLTMLALCGQLIYSILSYDRIYKGIYIDGTDVGGLDAGSALEKLKPEYDRLAESSSIDIIYKEKTIKIKFRDIDFRYKVDDAVKKAVQVGRQGKVSLMYL